VHSADLPRPSTALTLGLFALTAVAAWPRSAPPPLERATEGKGTLAGRVRPGDMVHAGGFWVTADELGRFWLDHLPTGEYGIRTERIMQDRMCVETRYAEVTVRPDGYTLVAASSFVLLGCYGPS
jgi:hypothetical protein